tara:strand:- start:1036 stop:1329 length:294 start_codon:yes stop_codon:yes gene_type:complete
MRRQRVTLSDLKSFMEEVSRTVPPDATPDEVPNNQRWIVETGLHHAAERHAQYTEMIPSLTSRFPTNALLNNASDNAATNEPTGNTDTTTTSDVEIN